MKSTAPLVGKKLTTALDDVVRQILHKKYPWPTCFVCDSPLERGWFHPQKNPKGCQVGHYVSRTIFQLRWDLNNVWPQGSPCNRIHVTNTIPFTARVIEKHGEARIEYLNERFKEYKGKSMTTLERRALLYDLQKILESLP